MNYIFHPEANREFLEAIDFYESSEPGLGEDFHSEIMETVGRIARGPEVWPVLEGEVRRCLVHRFPYGVLYSYSSENEAVFILAIMHLHREPDYWKHRMTED